MADDNPPEGSQSKAPDSPILESAVAAAAADTPAKAEESVLRQLSRTRWGKLLVFVICLVALVLVIINTGVVWRAATFIGQIFDRKHAGPTALFGILTIAISGFTVFWLIGRKAQQERMRHQSLLAEKQSALDKLQGERDELSRRIEADAPLEGTFAHVRRLRTGLASASSIAVPSSDLPQSVLASLDNLLMTWIGLVDKTDAARSLSSNILEHYLTQLSRVSTDGTFRPLLLANFEIYVSCVGAVLDSLLLSELQGGKTIRVTTLLKQPLESWYNIFKTRPLEGPHGSFTTDRWEDYKKGVMRIKSLRESAKPHPIHMRRIASREKRDRAKDYYLLLHEGHVQKVLRSHAVDLVANLPKCLHLLKDVEITLDDSSNDRKLYVIAEHVDGATCTHAGAWTNLVEHFEDQYHNSVHRQGQHVDDDLKGVFCTYADLSGAPGYEDIFLIDMSEIDGSRFGFAFYRDEIERPGIEFFLDEARLTKLFGPMDGLWSDGGAQVLD